MLVVLKGINLDMGPTSQVEYLLYKSHRMKNIIFIGGIHGVGKGTLCEKVCNELNLQHLSASEVLKWEEISEKENKLVNDFTLTQNRLILPRLFRPIFKFS